jgi:hypothetical protein
LADISALAARLRETHIRAIDPVDGSGRPGAAIWESVSGNSAMAPAGETLREPFLDRHPVSRGDFERLCHAAINFQI